MRERNGGGRGWSWALARFAADWATDLAAGLVWGTGEARRERERAEREELRGSRASHLEGVVELLGGSPKREGGA